MAKKQLWNDDYWLLLMQLYLSKPVGVKPMYSREMIALSLELHIPPQQLYQRQCDIANLETPRIERIWLEYSKSPQRLSRAVRLLREMKGFNSAGDFYEGVAVEETFERDFRPLAEDDRLMPFMLVMILDLYFRNTRGAGVGWSDACACQTDCRGVADLPVSRSLSASSGTARQCFGTAL